MPGDRLHVLRLCSVFEPVGSDVGAARFDPVGGMQSHTASLTRHLDDLGIDQTVVTARLAAPAGRSAAGRGVTLVRVGVRAPVLRQLWAAAAVPRVLRRSRPVDVVHAHQGEDVAALPLAVLAARRHRCPLVVTLHCSVGHTVTGRSPRALVLRHVGGRVERWALRRAAAVVVLAERTGDLVRGDGLPADRVHRIPSGWDPGLFAGAADPFADLPRPRVAYVGRMAAQKRPGLVVRAHAAMTERAHLLLVGDGPLRHEVEALVATSPRRGDVTLHGFVDHHRVPGVLAGVDVLALPSAYEELGSVLVEAMAAGVPVVATRVGGIPEVVADGSTGLLVPPGDAAEVASALARALDRVVGDPALAAGLRAGARERAAEWSWPVLAGRVTALYRSAAARRPGP